MLGYGTHDHSFTLQAVMDLKGSFGKLEASLENLNTSISSMKGKVDDLVNWKHRILGGAAVIAVVFTVVGVVIGKFGSYVSFHTPPEQTEKATQQPSKAATEQQPAQKQ